MLSVCQTNKHCRVPRLVCTLCRPLSSAHHYHCSLPLAPLQLQSQSSLQHFANASAEKLDSVSRLDLCRELGPGRDLREGREGAVTLTNQRPALANISQSEASSLVRVRQGTGLPSLPQIRTPRIFTGAGDTEPGINNATSRTNNEMFCFQSHVLGNNTTATWKWGT